MQALLYPCPDEATPHIVAMTGLAAITQHLTFASDAEWLAIWGILCWLLAGVSLLAERRRMSRARIDRIGWVPWTGLFLTFAVLGGGLLFMAVPGLLRG